MTDRPILFSAPMVQALLAGRKTQTRRVIKPRGHASLFDGSWTDDYVLDPDNASWRASELRFAIGDRLYVREHWRTFASLDVTPPRDLWSPNCGHEAGILYIADGFGLAVTREGQRWSGDRDDPAAFGKHRHAMHMPRWASRLTLIVTDVRVERLQDYSEADARDEGIDIVEHDDGSWVFPVPGTEDYERDAVKAYASLWDRINGAGSWESNPWVVAVTFDVLKQNIDEVR